MTDRIQHKKLNKLCCFSILLILFITTCFFQSAGASGVEVQSAPLVTMSSATNGMVRVYLSSMGNPSKLTITTAGSYSINGNTNQALSNGETVTVNFSASSGKLTITRNGVTTDMGSQFALRRHNTSGSNGVLIAESNSPANPYPGDLRFIVDKVSTGYKLYTIAYIYMENYMYGVLPYEMGNSAHIEALKAQAIAARTYTLRAMQSRTGAIYDVVDTTADQVYRGTPTGNANCKAAVDATKGIVVMNGSSLTGTFYTASNGGQTEASKNAWGGSGYDYLYVKDDPFDLANPDSVVKTATVYGDALSGSQNASLKSLLNTRAATAVQAMGYNGSSSVVTVLRINNIVPHTPKYADPSRLYTKMDFDLTVRTKNSAGSVVEVPATVTCDIFASLEGILGMAISSSNNELWTVTKSGSNFVLSARRYGHGIGLSQRGAMQMGRMGYTYDQIVGFYYEGCKRVQHNFTNTILSAIVAGEDPQEETTVETPAEIGDTGAPASAVVKLVSPGDMLGIRKQPNASAAIVGTVPHGVPVQVWAVDNGWAFIQYANISGYVQTSALTISGTAPATTDKTPTEITEYATVTAAQYLNLRAQGQAGAAIVGTAPSGAVLTVFSKTSQWAHVQYGAITAYASTDFLKFSSTYPGTTTDPTLSGATVTIPGGSGTVNLRSSASTSGTVLNKLAHGTAVTVLRNDGTWSKVQYQGTTGYIVSTYLTMTGEAGETPGEGPDLGEGEVEAVANPTSSTLNLRKTASQDAEILLEIPKGESVIVTQKGDTWCAVRYEGVSGYVMTQYLVFDTGEENPGEGEATYAQVTTQSGSLNMRTQGKTGSTILCTIPQYAYVTVVSKGTEWTRVKYAGYDGFVMTTYLTFLTPSQTPPPGATPTPAPQSQQARVTTVSGSLNLRKTAASNGTIITTIPQNATVAVNQAGNEWTNVTYSGKTGFVMTKFLTFLADATPTPSPTPSPSPTPEASEGPTLTPSPEVTPTPTPAPGAYTEVYVNTQSGSLNLRNAPKSGATILLRIPQYAVVTLISKGDTWSQISYGGKTGYVMTSYLGFRSVAPTPAPSPTPTPTPAPSGDLTPSPTPAATPAPSIAFVNTQSGSLNLRKEPKSTATIILRIPQYAQVTMISKGDTWSQVSYGGKTGYVMTSYLGFTSATPTPAPSPSPAPTETGTDTPTPAPTVSPTPAAGTTAWVNTQSGSLNMRQSASSSSTVILTIPQYSVIGLVEKGSAWCKVMYAGKTGYVQSGYLAFTGNPPTAGADPQIAWVLTASGSLYIRSKPESTAAKVATVPRLAQLTVYSKGSTWSQVAWNDISGYAMTQYLTFTKPAELSATLDAAKAAPTAAPEQSPATAEPEQSPAATEPVLDPTLVAMEDMTATVNPENATLNLRKECSETASILLEMPKGETVTLLMQGDSWCKVRYQEKEGYCMTKYLIIPFPPGA